MEYPEYQTYIQRYNDVLNEYTADVSELILSFIYNTIYNIWSIETATLYEMLMKLIEHTPQNIHNEIVLARQQTTAAGLYFRERHTDDNCETCCILLVYMNYQEYLNARKGNPDIPSGLLKRRRCRRVRIYYIKGIF